MIPRLLTATLAKSSKSVLLLGPRQVGKSTLIESLKPDLVLNLADEKTFLDFKTNPAELRERLGANPRSDPSS
jgi:predicted AAA+ superfamily ATPase